jgi:Uma2 family endonuclease
VRICCPQSEKIESRDRDYINKRAQYAAIAVPEYWLIDPIAGTVLMLQLQGDDYETIGLFSGGEAIGSSLIQNGVLRVDRVLGKEA